MALIFQHPLYYQQQEVFFALILYFNDSDRVILSFGSSLNCGTNVLVFSNNYCYIQFNYTLALEHLPILHYPFKYHIFC